MVRSSVTRTIVPRGRKLGEASPPSTEEIVVDGRYAWLLAETLREATNGRS